MLNCKETTELISLSCEQKLNFKRQLQLKLHLIMCPRCHGFAQNNKKLEQLTKIFSSHK